MLWVGESVVRGYQEKHSNTDKDKVVMQIEVSALSLDKGFQRFSHSSIPVTRDGDTLTSRDFTDKYKCLLRRGNLYSFSECLLCLLFLKKKKPAQDNLYAREAYFGHQILIPFNIIIYSKFQLYQPGHKYKAIIKL